MNFGVDKLFDIHPWKIVESVFNSEKTQEAESCFSLANEYMGSRGSFEEGYEGATLEGCYIGGIYVRQPIVYEFYRKAFPKESNFMVHTTNWFRTQLDVDGELFSMNCSVFNEYTRYLDMQRGLLVRELTFVTSRGKKTRLCWERLVSHADRHTAAASLTITALNHSSPVTVWMELDGHQENTHFGNACRHMVEVHSEPGDDSAISLVKKIRTTGQYFRHQMKTEIPPEAQVSFYHEENRAGQEVALVLAKGRTYRFSRVVSVFSSRDAGYPFGLIQKGQTEEDLDLQKEQEIIGFLHREGRAHAAGQPGYDAVCEAHIEAVSAIWKTLDIEIEGDDLSQQGIRFCMFQLFNTYRGFDGNLNVGAKGLTGEVYFGRYFWDTEAYCLPYYLLTNPEAARHLLLCRYNTLDAARDRARSFDYDGAWYAWQTIDGTEDLCLNEYAFGEVHINGIVPYALYFYTKTTGSTELLYKEGIEILIEMSRFWASRASYSPYRKGYGILKVMGPDEYQQFVNNNFYTNFMAKHALEYTLRVIEEMHNAAPQALQAVFERLHVDEEKELSKWNVVAQQMILNQDEELAIFVEDDEFLSNEEIHREELDKKRDIPVEKKWTIEKYQKAQLIKQPDVLLALFLFRDQFSMQQKRDNFRFYEQRTIHGSSLSPSIHSILANEIGRYHMAYQYYLYAARLDLEDYNNNTYEGLHITSLAGTWLNIVCGFGGLCIADDHIQFAPNLPQSWESLTFKCTYRGELLQVKATHDAVTAQVLEGARGIPVAFYGEKTTIGAEPKFIAVPEELRKLPQLKAVIFDLDGVLTDTARYHYIAWKQLADREGIYFDEQINERLKGVSRRRSLEIILERASRPYNEVEIQSIMTEKNGSYKKLLDLLTPKDVLPGIKEFIAEIRSAGVKTGVCSASCNTGFILNKLGLADWFDTVVSGSDVTHSKPHPEGFILAAERLGIASGNCLVIEDAFAGIQAGVAAGMKTLGIGWKIDLYNADYVLKSTRYLTRERAQMLF
jgi:alpha,alpha-trehalose phosphorylase